MPETLWNILEDAMNAAPLIPDYSASARYDLFVYGTMMSGLRNHYRLSRAQFIGPAKTVEPTYSLRSRQTQGGYMAPVMIPGGVNHVSGELYRVSGEDLWHIDMSEGHPVVYRREPIMIRLVDEKPHPALVYMFHTNSHVDQFSQKGIISRQDDDLGWALEWYPSNEMDSA